MKNILRNLVLCAFVSAPLVLTGCAPECVDVADCNGKATQQNTKFSCEAGVCKPGSPFPDAGTGGGSGGGTTGGGAGGGGVTGGGAGGGATGGGAGGGATGGGAGGGGATLDAGTTDEQIVAVRTAADTITDGGVVGLTIRGALVTYLKPLVQDAGTSDPAGFFIQGTQNGAALFVAIDPATVTGGPFVVGDLVDITVQTVTKNGGIRTVVSVTGATKSSSGNPTSGLTAAIGAVDFLAAGRLDFFESRLISTTGTTVSEPVVVGSGYKGVNFSTTGTPDAGANLRLRLPAALMDAQVFGPGCTFTLSGTPMWRFNASAQPSAWLQSEVANVVCPGPSPISANATSGTEVTVNFSRDLNSASVTPGAFTISATGGPLPVSAASRASARTVTLTTATQTAATMYTVTVGNTVTDTRGTAVPSSASSTTFTGAAGPVCNPGLIISAIFGGGGNASATYTHDYVELRNRTAAPINLAGWSVQYASISGASWTVNISLAGTIPANGFFLLRGASNGNVGVALPTVSDQEAPTLTLGANNGVVALVNSTTTLTACPAIGAVADLVGYGTAACREMASAAAISSTTAIFRGTTGCGDTNVNSADFAMAAVNSRPPRNTASMTANACSCP